MVFDYHGDSDDTFSSAFDTSEDDSTDDDRISITGELDKLSPAFCEKEGTKGKPINLASSTDEVTPHTRNTNSSSCERKGQLFSDTSDESQGDDTDQMTRKVDRVLTMPRVDDDDVWSE